MYFLDESVFQLRAYLFLARNLIASDETGLSDPFARVVLRNQAAKTEIKEQTTNPIWDQTIILEAVTFYSTVGLIKANPPPIIVEIFDWDDDVCPSCKVNLELAYNFSPKPINIRNFQWVSRDSRRHT